jgi:hypothetical protein
MSEGQQPTWMALPPDPPEPHSAVARWQRRMVRRLTALLFTGTVAFTLTTWLLVRGEPQTPAQAPVPPAVAPLDISGPAQTARTQLEALNKGDIRAAYDLFSAHYKQGVSFEAFRQLVSTHREMFRTREEEMESHEESRDRILLNLHLTAEDGESYLAHYTLTRIQGRWWVDDLHWTIDDDSGDDMTSA